MDGSEDYSWPWELQQAFGLGVKGTLLKDHQPEEIKDASEHYMLRFSNFFLRDRRSEDSRKGPRL